MIQPTQLDIDVFDQIKSGIINIDPVSFCESNLTLDGNPFRIKGNGYKPYADIYRQIGVNCLNRNSTSKPVILVKGRQVGATTMAAALELYFMASGAFGRNGKPPIRVVHAFPTLIHVHLYSKTKFNPMIKGAKQFGMKNNRKVSIVEAKLDTTSAANDSLQFKQFEGDNFVRIESTGLDADRLRGGTADVMLYDECFPYDQKIMTSDGNIEIGKLYNDFINNKETPKVFSFNESTGDFENKEIKNVWKREKKTLYRLTCYGHDRSLFCQWEDKIIIECTDRHRFLTMNGWKQLDQLNINDSIKTYCGFIKVQKIKKTRKEEEVYDIEVEDNHNFLVVSRKGNEDNGLVAHNCQDIPQLAIANANKMLTTAKYGKPGKGVQVYFGTPKQRNSKYYEMWQESTQSYYYLGCEKCGGHFPLYLSGDDCWERIWVHGYIVQCTECGHMQDKRDAAERGKWVSTRDEDDPNVKLVGYHINQLYNPIFTREDIEGEKPENSLVNTERAWMNEVLGEFFTGDSGPITKEEIVNLCGDPKRSMRARISPDENANVFVGFDWGKRNDERALGADEAKKSGGQSYSTCVVLREDGPNRLVIDYAGIVKKNDNEYKRNFIHEIMKQYCITQAVGDFGFAHELTEDMHREYNNRFLGCELVASVSGFVRFKDTQFPPIIQAQREHYIEEVFNVMKRGMIRFPLGGPRGENSGYDRISWLIDHCSSMEVKTTFNAVNEPVRRFVKGSTPNDGMMALVNAYIAFKYFKTNGFTDNKQGLNNKEHGKRAMAITGYCPF